MYDDDSRGRDRPARATDPPTNRPAANGRTAWIELTAFQRDCLEAITRLERAHTRSRESDIIDELERTYPSVGHARLDSNLRALVERGLLAKRDADPPTYRRTDAGHALIVQRAERLADACEIGIAATDRRVGDSSTRERGRNG